MSIAIILRVVGACVNRCQVSKRISPVIHIFYLEVIILNSINSIARIMTMLLEASNDIFIIERLFVQHYLFFILEIQKFLEIILLIILNPLWKIKLFKNCVLDIWSIYVILVLVIHIHLPRAIKIKFLRGGIWLIHLIILLKSISLVWDDIFFFNLKIMNFWI